LLVSFAEVSIHELVHFILRHAHLPSIRLSSLAGQGMVERMRSTGFALLGLTAAAGLALVAVFALPGFPLLDPAPLPNEPSAGVAGAEKVAPALASRPPVAAVALVPSPGARRGAGGSSAPGASTEPSGTHNRTGEVGTDSPVSAPGSAPETGGEEPSEGGPTPTAAPAPTPVPTSTPAETPAQPPSGSSSRGDSASQPTTATSDSGPGDSKSKGGEGQDIERRVEAASGHDSPKASPPPHGGPKATSHSPSDPPSAAPSPAAPPAESDPPAQPGHDSGKHLAKGH